jgi:endonuclease/exonuclease/phosphatase family metal-dependent hydrolase
MKVTVGTFNLNNLFSRFNFSGAIKEIQSSGPSSAMTVRYEFTDEKDFRVRTYRGKLVKAKDPDATTTIAARITAMNVDVLAVQEVEDIDVLREFNKTNLSSLYPFQVLIEGNDPRFIDVGLLSKLPIGAIASHQCTIHPENPSERVFSRDLLEVEILKPDRSGVLFTLFNNHLKSHFGDEDRGGQGKVENDTRRGQQAEMIAEIVSKRMPSDGKFIVVGDMNDPPDAIAIEPMLKIGNSVLFNALQNPAETRPAKPESGGNNPQTAAWTHRYKASGQPVQHELFDQIWLSPSLENSFEGKAMIDRRTKHSGDGSDHDPAWIELNL